jgi:uncharacterized protein YdeI (YjbR/CyaY-like superfamily)
MNPSFFNTSTDFRLWLQAHHTTHIELVVGFYKRDSGRSGLTYAEALDEALCFGWIDGLRKSIDAASYTIRFTPRKPGSIWSRVNLRHIERLQKSSRVTAAGLKVFQARNPAKCGIYAFENAARKLAPADERKFKADQKAWAYFQQQAPWYRRTAIWWIVNAKKDETRARRFAQLLKDSAAGRRLAHLTRTKSG